MEPDYDQLLDCCRALFASENASNPPDDAVTALRAMAREDLSARERLIDLLDCENTRTRILAAEALSWVVCAPERAVPVLVAVLQVVRESGFKAAESPWALIALGALCNYGVEASSARESVWPFLYSQEDRNLQLYATRYCVRVARASEADWAIACLLCRHSDEGIQALAREEFKEVGI